MSITEIDMKSFCAQEPGKYAIDKTWVKDGYEYATDGRICLRHPVKAEDTTEKYCIWPDSNKLFSEIKQYTATHDLDVALGKNCKQVSLECEECKGLGVAMEVCEFCDEGQSECPHCNSDIDCPKCNGQGMVPSKSGGKCLWCERGQIIGPKDIYLDGKCFANRYIQRIIMLSPNVRYAVLTDKMYFVFGEYEGLLMGCLPTVTK